MAAIAYRLRPGRPTLPSVGAGAMRRGMLRVVSLLVAALALPTGAGAACYADYKAKQDDPLRLHYGVIELPDPACTDMSRARQEVARRIAEGGWELLAVEGTFDASGLDARRASAGDFFLRY